LGIAAAGMAVCDAVIGYVVGALSDASPQRLANCVMMGTVMAAGLGAAGDVVYQFFPTVVHASL